MNIIKVKADFGSYPNSYPKMGRLPPSHSQMKPLNKGSDGVVSISRGTIWDISKRQWCCSFGRNGTRKRVFG